MLNFFDIYVKKYVKIRLFHKNTFTDLLKIDISINCVAKSNIQSLILKLSKSVNYINVHIHALYTTSTFPYSTVLIINQSRRCSLSPDWT